MANVPLVLVTSYYYDPTNGPTPLLQTNSLMAEDAAPKWDAFRAAMAAQGWEPYISPPTDPNSPPGYTKGFFRTPEDQALEVQEAGDGAAPVDNSPHQAARAFDLDLNALAAVYPDYDYGTLQQIAASAGFYNTAAGEPWHFDDNPAATYGSINAAVVAIGNTAAQIQADLAAGTPRPEQLAVSGSLINTLLLVGGLVGLAFWLVHRSETPKRSREGEGSHTGKGPSYVF